MLRQPPAEDEDADAEDADEHADEVRSCSAVGERLPALAIQSLPDDDDENFFLKLPLLLPLLSPLRESISESGSLQRSECIVVQ